MNEERLLELADHLEGLPKMEHDRFSVTELPKLKGAKPEGFHMFWWLASTGCGTSGCIAGHAATLWQDNWEPNASIGVRDEAAKELDLDIETAQDLFSPSPLDLPVNVSLESITPQEAARACRNVAEGKPAWKNMKPLFP